MADRLEPLKSDLRAAVGAANVFDSGETLESLSKDFYWYSPVLRRQLEDKRADVIIRPGSISSSISSRKAASRGRRSATFPRATWWW